MRVVQDSTRNLACSGVIEFQLPKDIVNDNPLMPTSYYWLKIFTTSETLQIPAMKVSFLDSQGIKLERQPSTAVPVGVQPLLAANKVTSPVVKTPEILSLVQPFESFGGKSGESQQEFQSRLSQRLKNKDRCSSFGDYGQMIYQAFPQIYYARCITNSASPGTVEIGLVRGIADPSSPAAFNPSVSQCHQLEVGEYLQQRISSQINMKVFSLNHQEVRVKVVLNFSNTASKKTVIKNIEQQISLFLSPWIDGSLPKFDLNTGIKRSDLVKYINNFDGVESIKSLVIETRLVDENKKSKKKFTPCKNEIVQSSSTHAILVPYEKHSVRAA